MGQLPPRTPPAVPAIAWKSPIRQELMLGWQHRKMLCVAATQQPFRVHHCMARFGTIRIITAVLLGLIAVGAAALTLLTGKNPLDPLGITSRASAPKVEPPQGTKPRAIPVKTAPVRRGTLERRINLTGDVEAEFAVQVFSKVAGVLEELLVQTGDRVTAGQSLGRIEWRELAARVDQAAALVKR